MRADDFRKTGRQRRDDPGRVIDRERRLGDVGQLFRITHVERRDIRFGLDQQDLALGKLAHRADRLGVAGMADHHDLEPVLVMALGLDMHLGDQRAGRVDIDHLAPLRLGRDGLGHAVGREDHGPVRRAFVQLLDEDGALLAQSVDDEAVVHDLVADIDRRAPFLQRHLDDLDRPVHAGAEAARRGEVEGKRGLFHRASPCGAHLGERQGRVKAGQPEYALGHRRENDVAAGLRHRDERQENAHRRAHDPRDHRDCVPQRRPGQKQRPDTPPRVPAPRPGKLRLAGREPWLVLRGLDPAAEPEVHHRAGRIANAGHDDQRPDRRRPAYLQGGKDDF